MAAIRTGTRHSQIYQQLVKRLPLIEPLEAFPTVAELMSEYAVSQATVTQALRRLQQQGLIRRPLGRKRYVVAPRAPRHQASIAVLRPFWPSPEYDSLLTALQQECTLRRWNLSLAHYRSWSDLDLHRLVGEHEGIISIDHPPRFSEGQENHLREKQYPFISLMGRPEDATFGGVEGDDVELGRLAVATLRELGHRRIAILLNEPASVSVSRRLRGWRAAMEEAGETDLSDLVIDCSVAPGQDSIELGRQMFDRWMERDHPEFTAVFATAWTGALAVMRVMHDRHIDLPGRCSLLSQGGLWPIGRYLVPALSTIDYNAAEWARAACGLLADQIADPASVPRSLNLAPEVHLRGTTAPPTA